MSTSYFVILFILILIFFTEIDFSFNSGTYVENFNLFGFIKPRNDGNWSNNMKKARYKAGNKKRVEEKKKAQLSKSQKNKMYFNFSFNCIKVRFLLNHREY